MSKCEIFLEYFNQLLLKAGTTLDEASEDVKDFYSMLQSTKGETEKVSFTPIGIQVLEFMQQSTLKSFKAKDIADGSLLPSRKVSGAMRKLVNDGYVEKWGASPVNYVLTNLGKNIELSDYKINGLDNNE